VVLSEVDAEEETRGKEGREGGREGGKKCEWIGKREGGG